MWWNQFRRCLFRFPIAAGEDRWERLFEGRRRRTICRSATAVV
ncbi:hypothetical protein PLANPX_4648 [Lacipirellula parvula]|uniref:Uncharacterized protein n=1 Tax=Lacipirellula parvula TaxID=2650471 RepID=A0A5K7XKI8_9BACT|nr:hypothetical protein PLANPX_4648 [Lacipirellula parvula]